MRRESNGESKSLVSDIQGNVRLVDHVHVPYVRLTWPPTIKSIIVTNLFPKSLKFYEIYFTTLMDTCISCLNITEQLIATFLKPFLDIAQFLRSNTQLKNCILLIISNWMDFWKRDRRVRNTASETRERGASEGIG